MSLASRGPAAALAFVAVAACANQPQLTSSDAGFVHWIGLDSRPLAVGSKLIVTLEIATDAGVPPAYSVNSSNPAVVTVEDAGAERLLLSVLKQGSATLQLQTSDEKAELAVTAATPVALTVSDAEHLAAGVDVQLGPSFAILSSSEEILQAVVLDASGRALNSWGLVADQYKGLFVAKREPEQFVLAPNQVGNSGSFLAGLIDAGEAPPEDGGAPLEDGGLENGPDLDAGSTASFAVSILNSASNPALLRRLPHGLTVVAQAMASDQTTEVFGVNDWEFNCVPSDSCTVVLLSPSVVSLTITPGSGSHDINVRSASQALTGKLVIPVVP